jgi:hypothetical protein
MATIPAACAEAAPRFLAGYSLAIILAMRLRSG